MSEERIFKMPAATLGIMAAAVIVVLLLVSVISGRGLSIVAMVGITIGLVVGMAIQKMRVSQEMVAFGKKKFLFASGTVSMEPLSGASSWLRVGAPNGFAVVYTPKQGGKVDKIYFPLSKQDQDELAGLLEKYNVKA